MQKQFFSLENISYCLILIFFCSLITVSQRNFFFIIPVIFILLGVILIVYQLSQKTFDLSKTQTIIIINFAAFSLTSLLIALLHHDKSSTLKDEVIPLLLIPAFIFFSYYLKDKRALFFIFPISAFLMGIVAIYDKFYLGNQRALELTQPVIPAAGIAMTLALFCLCLSFEILNKNKGAALILFISSFFAVIASILTGSRGAWICFPIVFVFLLYQYRKTLPKSIKLVFIPSFIIIFIICLFFFNTGIMLRFKQIYLDLTWYFNQHNANSSIGLRFEFWKSALDGFRQKPFLGWGDANYIHLKELQAQEGLIIADAIPFTHAHNQFLDSLVKKGLFHFLALVMLLLLPLFIFITKLQKNKLISLLGIILVFNTFTFCLTDLFLGLQLGMIFYVMCCFILLGYLLNERES